ncbi:glycosyltransferase family 4 protein [Malikia sp.]|uniref:glycosyltransferase family 4 protein n=1 Tax=Malikia sp. TaxID=2070706 RepID=UPI0026025DE2|nr:glycosyltransferase family 4 protein [Malikia sp.]MDD2728600.1 glycosyltransferase family 4 protein [Malikia sp.]
MRLLLLIKGLGLGGAEQHVLQLAVAMRDRGHAVCVAYLLPHKGELSAALTAEGIETVCWGSGGGPWWRSAWRRAWQDLHSFQPDTVHAHLPVTGMLARLFKPLLGYRLVYTEHITYPLLHPLTRLLHRASWWLDDAAVSCSQGVADSLPRASLVVDNGIAASLPTRATVTMRVALGIPSDARILLCVANLRPQKNHPLLLRAFDRASQTKHMNDWHIVLVGQDASERPTCEALAASLDSLARIHFAGKRIEAAAWMGEADAFVLSSDEEGLPLALLEAMRAGLPAVVTAVGGMPQVVTPETGIVVPRGDEAALATALQRLASDEALRTQMGSAARLRFTRHYTQDAMLDQLERLYEEKN